MQYRNSTFRKSFRVLLITLPFIVVAALIGARHRSEASPKPAGQAATPAVTAAKALDKPLHQWQEFTSCLRAVNTVEVRPRISGYIDRVVFTDGTLVKKGQLLFQIVMVIQIACRREEPVAYARFGFIGGNFFLQIDLIGF
jgi:multidrug efflux pump subunit AcrA (membrane-fusion protein)